MNAIRAKLRSQRGASITFALLLFLVCAVVSSVVIVAGTAAAGRMAKLPDMDQRYYAVTSAAGLLRDTICRNVTVKVNEDGTTDVDTVADAALLGDLSRQVVKCMKDKKEFRRTFKLSQTDVTDAKLNCTIKETVQSNGLATFDISSDDGTTEIYTLKIVFASSTKNNVSTAGAKSTSVTWKLHSVSKVRTQPT